MAGELNKIRMIHSGPPLSAADIHRFEQLINAKFPTHYVNFMLQHNGGYITPRSFYIDTSDSLDNNWVDVDMFHPIIFEAKDTLISRPDLFEMYERQRNYGPAEGLIPLQCIPIGNALGDDDLLLFVDGEHKGEVWVKLWHMCDDEDFPNPWSWCYKVGNDFFDFLGKLENGPD